MTFSIFPDLVLGMLIPWWGVLAPLILFIPVIIIEQTVILHLLEADYAFLYAFVMNLISTVVGLGLGKSVAPGLAPLVESWLRGFIPGADLYYGDPLSAVMLYALFYMALSCALSVLIEGVALSGMASAKFPMSKIWYTALIANLGSYLFLSLVTVGVVELFFNLWRFF